ncbi:MAG: YdcF family protein [Rhodomicrobium sp.]
MGNLAHAIVQRAVRICAIFAIALISGFFVFAHMVSVMPTGPVRGAEGIVVLTGDEDRISQAVGLLASGRGGRLLISGVNKTTQAPQIISLNSACRKRASLFRCCVDLDKRSLNTEGNAVEATVWARKQGFRSLIVVTSNYHMPRALIELRQAMPEAELVPYPVKSRRIETAWWHNARTSWVLWKEYLKFVTASARLAANRLANGSGKAEPKTRTINARIG